MRGCLTQRSPGSWAIVLHMGYVKDPLTNKRKLKQKWVTVRGTKAQAQAKLNEMLVALQKGEFVEPTKVTLGEWLDRWCEETIKSSRRPGTYTIYRGVLDNHVIPEIGAIRLQALRPGHLQAYYADRATKRKLAAGTLQVQHAVISAALKSAVRQGLLTRNVATLVDGRPRSRNQRVDAKAHCWTLAEAQTFLAAAKKAGPQLAAFFALALDSGARKGELCALRWSDIDLDAGRMTIDRTLLKPGPEPVFGPTKNGAPRSIDLNSETVRLLRMHKKQQAALRMKNRRRYRDLGLVFAREWDHVRGREDSLGMPLQANNLGERDYARVVRASGVRRIKFHGLRHTCATLLLGAREPVHVVSQRLGHKDPTVTLAIYAHCLPSMQQEAAARLGDLLYGGGR
jgi:integrase